jgi:hypothetical protein
MVMIVTLLAVPLAMMISSSKEAMRHPSSDHAAVME